VAFVIDALVEKKLVDVAEVNVASVATKASALVVDE
jgi:hypothetical protein